MSTFRNTLIALAACAGAAHAAPAADRAAVETRYRAEQKACAAEASQEARRNCLREAAAARADALSGRLDTGAAEQMRLRNRLARCGVHRDPIDRHACERMALGEGRHSGSVEQGAVLRELTTTIDAPEAPASGSQ